MAQLKLVIANRVVEGHSLGDRAVLGRSRDADIVLPDPSVSREHAVIERDGAGYAIEDRGSKAGVRVNGRAVTRASLNEGDVITLGALMCVFTLEADPPPPERSVRCETPADLHADVDWRSGRDIQVDMAGSRANLDAVGPLLSALLEGTRLDPQDQLRYAMACQEALGNAVRHGNQGDEQRRVRWRLIRDDHRVSLRIRDEGAGFDYRAALKTAREGDPLAVARARYAAGRPGGLGIMMMVRGCDMVEFGAGGAEICLIKCPSALLGAQTVYSGVLVDDEGPSIEDLIREREAQRPS